MIGAGIAFILMAYSLGMFPTGKLVGERFGVKIEETGSKAIGMTNVFRTTGKLGAAFLTFCVDAFIKGSLTVFIARYAFEPDWVVVGVFIAVLLGHTCPMPLISKAKGKGIATLIGGLIVMPNLPIFFLIALIVWLTLIFKKRMASLANLVAISILLIGCAIFNPLLFTGLVLCVLALILWTHRENIQKMRKGTEDKLVCNIKKEKVEQLKSVIREIIKVTKETVEIKFVKDEKDE